MPENGNYVAIIAIIVTIVIAVIQYFKPSKAIKDIGTETREILENLAEFRKDFRRGLAILIVFIGLSCAILSIIIQWGDNTSNQAQIENNKMQLTEVLDSIESRELATGETSVSMREKGYFHYKDRRLSDRLSAELSDTHPEGDDESIEQRTNRLNLVLADNSLIADLRDRARQHLPPFQYIGTPVRVGVPSGNQPRSSTVYVAFESEFEGRVVQIRNPKNERHLTLRAIGAFHPTTAVDFQMNTRQAIYLFGRVNTTVRAVVFILPPSTQPHGVSGQESLVSPDVPVSE